MWLKFRSNQSRAKRNSWADIQFSSEGRGKDFVWKNTQQILEQSFQKGSGQQISRNLSLKSMLGELLQKIHISFISNSIE